MDNAICFINIYIKQIALSMYVYTHTLGKKIYC